MADKMPVYVRDCMSPCEVQFDLLDALKRARLLIFNLGSCLATPAGTILCCKLGYGETMDAIDKAIEDAEEAN